MTKNAVLLALLATLAASTAGADTHKRHGTSCMAKHSSRELVGGDERGIYNASTTTAATVTCAVSDRVSHDIYQYNQSCNYGNGCSGTYANTPEIKSVVAHVRDLSSTTPFSCYVYWSEADGFSSWGPTKYACSQSGGCPDTTSQFTGATTLSWSLGSSSIASSDHVGIVCSVPPTTSSGSSYVKGIDTKDTAEVSEIFDGEGRQTSFTIDYY